MTPNTDNLAVLDDFEEEITNTPLPVTPGCSRQLTKNKKRKRDEDPENNVIINEAEKLLKKLNETDADDAYGQFIVSMLKEIKNEKKRHLARIEIQKLLLNYIYDEEE